MNIIVLFKQVPDLVEELEISAGGTDLDRSYMKMILSEYDDHALEQALIIKETLGGTVKVLAPDMPDVDEAMFSALAKGADSVVKIRGNFENGATSHALAKIYADILRGIPYDIILTGVQAIDDLDGSAGAMLASFLDLPYVGVVSGVSIDQASNSATVRKEYPGGVLSEITTKLPVVIGIQAAEKPPRYVPIARIRQVMKTSVLDEATDPELVHHSAGLKVRHMFKPETTGGAAMIEGNPVAAAAKIFSLLSDKGMLR